MDFTGFTSILQGVPLRICIDFVEFASVSQGVPLRIYLDFDGFAYLFCKGHSLGFTWISMGLHLCCWLSRNLCPGSWTQQVGRSSQAYFL